MDTEKNDLDDSADGIVIKINLSLLQSVIYGFIAWKIWPDSLIGYGWGLLSIILSLVSVACGVSAVRGMIEIYSRNKKLTAYMGLGAKPKSSTLASDDALKDAGMR